jgi:hypothetical protein
VEPVQLQAVCQSLWSKLPPERKLIRHADLEEFGSVDEPLGELYDEGIRVATTVGDMDEGFVRTWFERHLITPVKTRGMALQGDRDTEGLPNRAVTVLEDLHLVRAVDRAGAPWYELSHDRFLEPIIQSNEDWRGVTKNQLALAAREWDREGRDRGALLRGERLRKIAAWASTRAEELDPLEEEFLRLSRAATLGAQLRIVITAPVPILPLLLSFTAIVMLWESVEAATTPGANPEALRWTDWRPADELLLMLWVAAFGALGGSVQTTRAFIDYVRNPRVNVTSLWSITLHALVGIALAALFWVSMRGVLLRPEASTSALNRYGIAALAGLIGFLAKQATDKLKELLDTLFHIKSSRA